MSKAESRLTQFYRLFGERRFRDLHWIWYIQFNSMKKSDSPKGQEAVSQAYANWGKWFQGMQISQLA